MSANERMGALSNWARCGFDRHDPDCDPSRCDRHGREQSSRSPGAERGVRAIHRGGHRGTPSLPHRETNVRGLWGLIQKELPRHVAGLAITDNLPRAGRIRGHRRRPLDAAFRRLAVGRTDAPRA